MRLLNVTTRVVEEFDGNDVPKYALLSHTWGPDEVTQQEMDAIARYHRPQHESGAHGMPRSPDDPDAVKLLLSTMLLAFRGSRARFSHPSTRPALTNGHEMSDEDDTGFRRLVPAPSSHPFEAKAGYQKIAYACGQAEKDGLQYLWVDTCCVDRRSGGDVSEAINSIFAWCQKAAVCYAYLEDVHYSDYTEGYKTWKDHFNNSRWFTRSWTLQELLAPSKVVFYAKGWRLLGTKSSLVKTVERITGIDQLTLLDPRLIHNASVARRMSWAAARTTTRTEDIAYSLLGIFGIHMPIMYGEGDNAFLRLQEEIMKRSDDHSIFAWGLFNNPGSHLPHHPAPPDLDAIDPNDDELADTTSMLAKSPANFAGAAHILPTPPSEAEPTTHHALTNKGLLIHLPLFPPNPTQPHTYLALLNCHFADSPTSRLAVLLTPTRIPNLFLRALTPAGEATTILSQSDLPPSSSPPSPAQPIYIPTTTATATTTNLPSNPDPINPTEVIFIRFPDLIPPGYAVTSVHGQGAQWNREAGKLRVTGGSGKGVLWQVAVVAFWNRHLGCGLIVRALVEGRGGGIIKGGFGKRGKVFADLVYGGPGEEDGFAGMAKRVWDNPGSVEVKVPPETMEDGWTNRTDWVRVVSVREEQAKDGEDAAGVDGRPFRMGDEPNLCRNMTFTERWEREYKRTVTTRIERKKKGAIELSLASVLWQSPSVE
ncbi:vegetative incompatibility protein HET-E-1 [Staphylotrichum tortipilum]|uniref:Vegetative incompatibility protein HET-E-1 n=1 Tax=Staphylotrichum tortipilum TaxID=2831512 RepID=A0AAN6RW35_9PEZI|nr:vegetative incompatibility protein HET-E-1 [Staphylotrichum longicolle]